MSVSEVRPAEFAPYDSLICDWEVLSITRVIKERDTYLRARRDADALFLVAMVMMMMAALARDITGVRSSSGTRGEFVVACLDAAAAATASSIGVDIVVVTAGPGDTRKLSAGLSMRVGTSGGTAPSTGGTANQVVTRTASLVGGPRAVVVLVVHFTACTQAGRSLKASGGGFAPVGAQTRTRAVCSGMLKDLAAGGAHLSARGQVKN